MDVYIEGMEIPKGFTDIRIYADGRVVSQSFSKFGEQIATAIHVPAHGDLIDRNVLYYNMFIGPDGKVFPDRDVDNFPHEMRFEDIKRFIRKAQTVIQASE